MKAETWQGDVGFQVPDRKDKQNPLNVVPKEPFGPKINKEDINVFAEIFPKLGRLFMIGECDEGLEQLKGFWKVLQITWPSDGFVVRQPLKPFICSCHLSPELKAAFCTGQFFLQHSSLTVIATLLTSKGLNIKKWTCWWSLKISTPSMNSKPSGNSWRLESEWPSSTSLPIVSSSVRVAVTAATGRSSSSSSWKAEIAHLSQSMDIIISRKLRGPPPSHQLFLHLEALVAVRQLKAVGSGVWVRVWTHTTACHSPKSLLQLHWPPVSAQLVELECGHTPLQMWRFPISHWGVGRWGGGGVEVGL